MDPILEMGFVTAVIGGTEWKMHRKCTAIMAAASKTTAALGATNSVKSDKPPTERDTAKGLDLMESILRQALVHPRIAEDGEQSVEGEVYQYDEIKAYHDGLFAFYLKSGLDVSLFQEPCEEKRGEYSQGR